MLLVTININGTDYRVSDEAIQTLTNRWHAKISDFEGLTYTIEQQYGGYCNLSFGSMTFTPDLFEDDWPPPAECDVTIQYTETTQEAAETFFTGKLYLSQFSREAVTYSVYSDTGSINLLEEVTSYDEDTVPAPRMVGSTIYVPALRLQDHVDTSPQYHKGHVAGTKGVNWYVFDDGVDISSNVTDNGDGTFKLSAVPVGQVSISGTGEAATLAGTVEWACGASYLNLTYNGTYARDPSPALNHWASSQMPLTQFLSDICAYCSHLFYIKGSTLYLVDMKINNGSRIIDEFQYMPADYQYSEPVSLLKAVWQLREAGEWREKTGGGSGAVYVKETEKEVTVDTSYPYGQKAEIDCFQENHDNIVIALEDIKETIEKPMALFSIPLQGSLPNPGEKIQFVDTSLVQDTTIKINVRTISYDFIEHEIIIDGDGQIL